MQNNKSAGRASKSAVQAICDAIFKVVDHRLKELDNKWTKQLKKTGRGVIDESGASSGLKSVSVPFSIAVNDWVQMSDDIYMSEVLDDHVTKTMLLVECNLSTDTAENIIGPICWETAAGKAVLSVLALPRGAIAGELFFCEVP